VVSADSVAKIGSGGQSERHDTVGGRVDVGGGLCARAVHDVGSAVRETRAHDEVLVAVLVKISGQSGIAKALGYGASVDGEAEARGGPVE